MSNALQVISRLHLIMTVQLFQWFLTWGPGTPWGSQTPILGVPNANLEYQQISPNMSNMKSIRYQGSEILPLMF